MELTYHDQDGIRTIALKGRMDLEGAAVIDLRFTTLTAAPGSLVVVDLSELDFMASMGLATLVRGAKTIKHRDGNIVLLNPKPSVRQVLASTRIDQVLPVYATYEEARLALTGSSSPID
jgi:anti-anti-sigma factor